MTRDNLIKFLQENYEPDEELLWQTLSFDDVKPHAIASVGVGTWAEFVEKQEYYGEIADEISELVVDKFNDYTLTEEEEDN
jgi:hypothetical protein